MSSAFIDNDFCFACGSQNPLGLHLCFQPFGWPDGAGGLSCRVQPQPHWQGWENVMHGGIQATILDDLMSNHLFRLERAWAVTTGIETRFRRPVPLDQPLFCASRFVQHSGRQWELSSAIWLAADADRRQLTTATGRFLTVEHP